MKRSFPRTDPGRVQLKSPDKASRVEGSTCLRRLERSAVTRRAHDFRPSKCQSRVELRRDMGQPRRKLSVTPGIDLMVLTAIAAIALTSALPQLVQPKEKSAYAALLNARALDADARFSGSRCDGARVESLQREDVYIGTRPDLAAAREKVRVTGCGRTRVENVAVARLGGDPPWRMVAGLPGETLAEMQLQQTAAPQVFAQVRASGSSGCGALTLDEIYVAARPGHVRFTNLGQSTPAAHAKFEASLPAALLAQREGLDTAAAWTEVWPLPVCGVGRTVAVVFVPNRLHEGSFFFVIPVWQQIETYGPGARPAKDPGA